MSVSGAAATSPSGVCGAVIHGLGGCLRVVSEDPDSEQQMATLQHQWTRCLRPEPRDREAPVISLGATPDNEPAFWERTTQRITAELIGQHPHAVLMGDLNTSARSKELDLLYSRTALARPDDSPATFPSWKPTRALDHILVSQSLVIERLWALPHPVSDHLPIAACVRLPDSVRTPQS